MNGTPNYRTPNSPRHISAIKWSTAAAVVGVAIIAAIVSYNHAYALVTAYGEGGWTARLVPLTVDGLIYASSMVLLHSARQGAPVPRLARWLLALGIAATLAANALHGLDRGPIGAIVAAWPAVALVGTYELLMTIVRSSTRAPEAVSAVPETDPLEVQAAEAFAEDVSAGRTPTVRAIRMRLRIGQPRAQRVQTYLSTLIPTPDGDPA